jgi:hypothetical protein
MVRQHGALRGLLGRKQAQLVPVAQRHPGAPHRRHHLVPLLEIQPPEVGGRLEPELLQRPRNPPLLSDLSAHNRGQQLVF